MALDTQAKRNSSFLDLCAVVIPDGTIDADDRATTVGQYGGGLMPPPPSGGNNGIINTSGDLTKNVVRVFI